MGGPLALVLSTRTAYSVLPSRNLASNALVCQQKVRTTTRLFFFAFFSFCLSADGEF